MRNTSAPIATALSRIAVLAAIALAGCMEAPADPDSLPSCWIHDCPGDPGATTCGTCQHPGVDVECPPGFVCSCDAQCVKGPRSYDGGVCSVPDAGVDDLPDAQVYEWPECDQAHPPGT